MYRAEFNPQVRVNDHAFSIDPSGPTVWDCTDFVLKNPELKASVDTAVAGDGTFLDITDELRADPAIPDWTKEHRGPFTITAWHDDDPLPSGVCLLCGAREAWPGADKTNVCPACKDSLLRLSRIELVQEIDKLLGRTRARFTADLPECDNESRLLTARLAQRDLPSLAELSPVDRFEATRTMLADLQRLAREDGCVAAGWALELAQHVDDREYYLTPAQLGTILGALRLYQCRGMCVPENRSAWIDEIVTDGGTETALTSEDVDDLAMWLNQGVAEGATAFFTSTWGDDGSEITTSLAAVDEAHRLVDVLDCVDGPEDATLHSEYVTYRGRRYMARHISERDEYSVGEQAKMFFYR